MKEEEEKFAIEINQSEKKKQNELVLDYFCAHTNFLRSIINLRILQHWDGFESRHLNVIYFPRYEKAR